MRGPRGIKGDVGQSLDIHNEFLVISAGASPDALACQRELCIVSRPALATKGQLRYRDSMKIYLINLDRRHDRRTAMEGEAAKTRLSFTRIAALDGQSPESAGVGRWFAASGPLGPLSHSEKCCALSHRLAWSALVESGDAYAVILEDDVRLASAAGALLASPDWVPPDVDILKLEHFGPENQHVLVTQERKLGHAGVAIARLASRHTGAGAYLLSRRAAQRLLDVTRFTLPVDHMLFNPNNSPLFAALLWRLGRCCRRSRGSAISWAPNPISIRRGYRFAASA